MDVANLLTATVTSAITKIAGTTDLVATVKDQFGTAMQYYAVTANS
jgi:hypothetical protein